MKTLIVYCSNHGATEKCAHAIQEKLQGKAELVNLKSKAGQSPSVHAYDIVLIGGSIHVGSIQKEVQEFVRNNEQELLKKHVGLFLCSGLEGEVQTNFSNVFPQSILDHAFAKLHMGHAFYFDKMGFFTKMIVKNVAKVHSSEEKINYDHIDLMAQKVRQLGG